MEKPDIPSDERESCLTRLDSCPRIPFGGSYSSSKLVREDVSPPPLSLSKKEDAVEDIEDDVSDLLRFMLGAS
jgi:hypothetical protein